MGADMDTHLEVRDVSKSFDHVKAVDGLSLAVARGAVFGLLGPNGAGKTTTIRMIMRITLPDSGTIRLGGVTIDDDVRERIGYLPEERGLYRKMKVIDQLVFLGEVRGLPRPEARRRSVAWLQRLDLAGKANAKVEELSKGMQQKVQFAGAVIHEPELVILDEPFAGLDPIATRLFKDEIAAMRARGATVVFSTHVLPQAEELCDDICLINRGHVVLQGRLDEIRVRHSRRCLRVVTRAGEAELRGVPGVAAVRALNGAWAVDMADGVEGPALIRELAARVPVEAAEPLVESLEDIFLRNVEADHAAVA
jgi:ABC-2 type transport system ATP-binding protein